MIETLLGTPTFFPLDLSTMMGSFGVSFVVSSTGAGKTGGQPKSSISRRSLSAQA